MNFGRYNLTRRNDGRYAVFFYDDDGSSTTVVVGNLEAMFDRAVEGRALRAETFARLYRLHRADPDAFFAEPLARAMLEAMPVTDASQCPADAVGAERWYRSELLRGFNAIPNPEVFGLPALVIATTLDEVWLEELPCALLDEVPALAVERPALDLT